MLSVLYKKETVNAAGFEPRIFQLKVQNLVNQPFLLCHTNSHKYSLKHVRLALYKVVHLKIARKSPYLSAKFKVKLAPIKKILVNLKLAPNSKLG